MNRQNHSEPENRLTQEEQQEFLELLARLSPEQREALKEVLKSFTKAKQCGVASCHPALFIFCYARSTLQYLFTTLPPH